MHATKEARKKHNVAECSSPSHSSSNSALNPVVPLRDTCTKVHSSVDADNFIVNFYIDLENVTRLKEFLETNSLDDIVGPALANSMPPWYFDLANAMRAHMTTNGALVPTCAVSTFSSTNSLNACVNLHVSYVVAVLRPLMCGDRKFSSHDGVNELDTIGDHIADIAKIESHAQGSEAWRSLWVALLVDAADRERALVSRIASHQNLGDGDKQTEDDDDDTVIDLKEYTCVENFWRQWDDNADSLMSECRLLETKNASCFHCTNRRCC